MSTKLYNGYKINNLSVRELKEFMGELKTRLKRVFDFEYGNYFGHLATSMIDETITWDYLCEKCGSMNKLENYLTTIYKNSYNKCWIVNDFIKGEINTNIEDALKHVFNLDYLGSVGNITHNTIESKNFILNIKGVSSSFNLQNEIVLFPSQNKTLFLAYGDLFISLLDKVLSSKRKEDRNFRKKYGFEYYGYWNNTDKPNNISQKRWDERGNEWKELLAPDYIPSKHGICSELISEETFFNEKELDFKLDANFPSPSERAKKIALEIIRKNWTDTDDKKDMSAVDLIEKFNDLYEQHFFDTEIASIQSDLEKLFPVIDEKAIKTKLINFAPNYKKIKGIL